MRNAISLFCAIVLWSGCVSAPRRPYVTLEPDGEAWRATWHLPAPARELRFDRETPFRASLFDVVTPGYAIVRDGDAEVLRTDGPPSAVITVRFPEHTGHLPKDYEFFQKFSDGSVAVYTGHLLAHANGALIRTFRLVSPDGVPIVVGGKRSTSPVTWADDAGQGTYAYFGSIEPVVSEHTIAIVDPALPDWLESTTREALPRLFAVYAERLGAELPERPTVLFNSIRSNQSGYSSSGGTLPGVIQLAIEGTGWETESAEGRLQILHFLAHEAAHLWNGQIAHYPETEHSWMHEGSADGLAQRALLEMGLIDAQRFLDYQTEALNQCRRGLGVHPLRTAGARQSFELYYTCGNALATLTEASSRGDLFAFWRLLIARAVASGGHYDLDDYVAAWRESGASADDVTTLRALVESASSAAAIADALAARGVGMAPAATPPQPYGQSLARAALFHLLGEQCQGSYGFNTSARGLALQAALQCETFKGGVIVTAIGGHSVLREGHRAWDHLHDRCGSAEPVLVRAGDRDVEVKCSRRVAPRPEYVRVTTHPFVMGMSR